MSLISNVSSKNYKRGVAKEGGAYMGVYKRAQKSKGKAAVLIPQRVVVL